VAERLTADELITRLDITGGELVALRKAGMKAVRTKGGDRFGWPSVLHWYVRYRELQAEQLLPKTVSQAQFAELSGKTDKTIFNWRRSGMPSEPDAKDPRHPVIPLVDAVRWLVTKAESRGGDKGEDPHEMVKLEQSRMALAMSQIKYERMRASIVDVEFMKREFEELVHATLSVLDGLPPRVAPELAPLTEERDIRQVLERELSSTREQWADAVVHVAERTDNELSSDEDEESEDDATPDLELVDAVEGAE
jgi:phage terminase Nu1 subunit (DNA packaging protein)